MAKSLGLIHTLSYDHTITSPAGGGSAGSSNMLLDLSGELTTQLQHMVRCGGNTFKTVGVDMALDLASGSGDNTSVAINGTLMYYTPTAGRVAAMKEAWEATKRAFKLQGIDYRANKNYDWRPLITNGLSNAGDFKNQASIEILAGAPTPLYIKDQSASTTGIFENWNNNVSLQSTAAPDFSVGWNVMQGAVQQDYVLNEGAYLVAGGREFANENYEEIPFQLALDYQDGQASATFQFRPDPALYVSILAGQIIMIVDDAVFSNVDDPAYSPTCTMNISVYVAGWRSIMGGHRRHHRRSKKGGKRHGRKRHSKK